MIKNDYWIGVINSKNFDIVKKKLIYGVESKNYRKIKKIKIGDKLLFYILGKKIIGLFEVTTKFFIDKSYLFFGGIYPYRIKLKRIKSTPQKEFNNVIIQKLSFIKNKKSWGGCFRGTSLINIPKKDYKLLKKYLKI